MIGFALVTCVGSLAYAILLLVMLRDARDARLRHRLPMPLSREAWLRQQDRIGKESGR